MAVGLADFLQFFTDVRGDIGDVIRGFTKVAVDREKEVFFQHALNDVFRGAYEVEVFLPTLDFGEHDFIDIEYLVDDADIFACLFFVPGGEFGKDVFVDVVGPVVDFENTATLLAGTGARSEKKDAEEEGYVFLHCFYSFFERSALLFITISNTNTVMKMMVDSGRNSGVNPPLRASA